MSRDLNSCNFIGRLGRDPEVKFTASGSAICNLALACGDDYMDKNTNQKVEKTEWINCVAFGKSGETIAEYCKKGSVLFISGKMQTKKYTDSAGVVKYSTSINVSNFQFLGGKSEGSGQTSVQNNKSTGQKFNADAPEDDQIPY